jgi:hypothetical protein
MCMYVPINPLPAMLISLPTWVALPESADLYAVAVPLLELTDRVFTLALPEDWETEVDLPPSEMAVAVEVALRRRAGMASMNMRQG